MKLRLTLTTLVTILFMATACASEPTPPPDTRETDRLSRQVQKLQEENATIRNEMATLTAAGSEQQQTPAPGTPVTEIFTPTPVELDAKPSRPTDNICSRSPHAQKILLNELSVRICSIVTGEDLFHIEEIDIYIGIGNEFWEGDLDNMVNIKKLGIRTEQPLPTDIFADLINLEDLHIEIEHDEPWSLEGMLTNNTKLMVLRIETSSEMPITLTKEALEGLQELEEISIEEITSLDDDAFNGLESLKKVELTGAFTDEQIEAREFVFPANMVRDNPGIEHWNIGSFAFPKVIPFASLEQFCRLRQYDPYDGQSRIGINQETEYQVNGEKVAIVSSDNGVCRVGIGEPDSNGSYPESQIKIVDGRPQATP